MTSYRKGRIQRPLGARRRVSQQGYSRYMLVFYHYHYCLQIHTRAVIANVSCAWMYGEDHYHACMFLSDESCFCGDRDECFLYFIFVCQAHYFFFTSFMCDCLWWMVSNVDCVYVRVCACVSDMSVSDSVCERVCMCICMCVCVCM
jgi:hypothetical protein